MFIASSQVGGGGAGGGEGGGGEGGGEGGGGAGGGGEGGAEGGGAEGVGGENGEIVASLLLRAATSSWLAESCSWLAESCSWRLATSASRSTAGGDAGGGDGGGAWARHITSERPSICVKVVRSASAAASCADVERGPASAVVAIVMKRRGMNWAEDAGVADRATCATEMPSSAA